MLSDHQVCPHPRFRYRLRILGLRPDNAHGTYYAGAARVQQPQRITRLATARPPAVTTRIRPATEEKTCANS
jgi:hypothetical protein